MARPVSGKVTTATYRTQRKNGDIYVFERQSRYDPKVGYARALSTKLLGKIRAGTTEMVPTRPRKKPGENPQGGTALMAARLHIGATQILSWVGKASGIDDDLAQVAGIGMAQKISTIARFWLSNPGSTLVRMAKWQRMHPTPYDEVISKAVYHKLFEAIGENENLQQNYFERRARGCKSGDVLAYDSTTVSTYSENLSFARKGYNKDHDGNDTVKLLTIYSLKTRQPILLAKQPGNIPDVISVDNTLKRTAWLGYDKVQVVTDNGYCSDPNILEYLRRHMKFLTLIGTDRKWIRPLLDKYRDELLTAASVCPWDLSIHAITIPIQQEFSWVRERSSGSAQKGEEEKKAYRLYVHIYKNQDNIARDEKNLLRKIMGFKKQLEEGQTEFTESAQQFIERFFTITHLGRGGKCKATVNEETFAQARKNYGYFALVSNKAQDAYEALRIYRLREKIEESYRVYKEVPDGDTPRVWYDDNFSGRLFCQFVTLGYWCFLHRAIADMKTLLSKKDPTLNADEKKRRKELRDWLESMSMVDILDWFDCYELTNVQGGNKDHKMTSEMLARDRLFLQLLTGKNDE